MFRKVGPLWFGLLFAAIAWIPSLLPPNLAYISAFVIILLFIFSGLQDCFLKRFGVFPGMALAFVLCFAFVFASAFIFAYTSKVVWVGIALYFVLGLLFGLLRQWALRWNIDEPG